MNIEIYNTIRVNKPSDDFKKWCENNLIIENPVYSKKKRMGLWIGNTPKILTLYEIKDDDYILPYGTLYAIHEFLIKNPPVSYNFKPLKTLDYGQEINLYPYQDEAVKSVIKRQVGILQSPAGSGKTQMGLAIVKKLGLKTLWIAHTKDLIDQSKQRALQYFDKSLLGTITGGKINISKGITFATIQTLSKINLLEYQNEWDLIIVDEAHRIAGTPTSITMYRKVLNTLAAKYKYGLSATVHRADGLIKATTSLIGEVVYRVPLEVVGDKVVKVYVKTVGIDLRISQECLNPDGTLNYQGMISYITNDFIRNLEIVRNIKDRPTLVLSDRLEHLCELESLLSKEQAEKAVMIHGMMRGTDGEKFRQQALEDMRNGKKDILFATYSLAKEGLDIPRLEHLHLTTPQKDYAVITQSIGRIARTYPNKREPICFDYVDNMGYTMKSYKQRLKIYAANNCELL